MLRSRRSVITGLFGYLLRRSAADALLGAQGVFPLRHQVDVAVAMHEWPTGSRYALSPDAVLLTSPKSEAIGGDTDVQTLGRRDEAAHAELPPGMLRL